MPSVFFGSLFSTQKVGELSTLKQAKAMGDAEASGGDNNNVKVMTRMRLFNKRETEISAKEKKLLRPCVRMRDKTVAIIEFGEDSSGFPIEREREAFQFDECFWSMPAEQHACANDYATQQMVYEKSGRLALDAALAGYNVCIFAYGQTGSGKTYSMLGTENDPGISPRLVDDLFGGSDAKDEMRKMTVKMIVELTFFEIYNEKVRDLFKKTSKTGEYDAPKIRQHPTKGVFVEGLHRKEVSSADVTKRLIEKGTKERALAETKMNAASSRSHAIFQIQITQNDAMKGTQRVSTINLVDLAGSEKIKMSGATGETLTEAKNINQSLSTLRKVIDVLIENSTIKSKKHKKVAPYRESVLTYCLSDSLGGNSKTQMIATISPHEANLEDTLGTLRYALRAKAIVCNAKVNEEKSAAMMDAMKEEIMLLQQKLKSGGGKGGMTDEIKAQIEERQKEIEHMEETQHEMQKMLEVAKEKEEEMNKKLAEVQAAQAELDVQVQEQKKERFAAAFRNAFRISGEKQKVEVFTAELEELRRTKKQLEDQNQYLQSELTHQNEQHDEFRKSTDERMEQMVTDMNARDTQIAQLRRQLGNANEEMGHVKSQNEALSQRVVSLESYKQEVERRVTRLQEELLAANATIEREIAEKERQKEAADEKTNTLQSDLDNARKRKDRYKQLYMEAQARVEASKTVVDALQSDRKSFLDAIKAQQHVVEEQSNAVQRMLAEKRDTEERSRQVEGRSHKQQEELKHMAEALREYQNAASEWAYENHAVTQELERVSKGYSELRSHVDSGLSPSPARSTRYADPNRTASPAGFGRQSSSMRGGSTPRY